MANNNNIKPENEVAKVEVEAEEDEEVLQALKNLTPEQKAYYKALTAENVLHVPSKKKPGTLDYFCNVIVGGFQACGYTSEKTYNVNRHCTTTHWMNKYHNCCNINFTTQGEYDWHRKQFHTVSFSCTFGDCDRKFKRKAQLDRHVRIHTGDKPFVCPYGKQCNNYKSTSKANCDRHIVNLHRELAERDNLQIKGLNCYNPEAAASTRRSTRKRSVATAFGGAQPDGIPPPKISPAPSVDSGIGCGSASSSMRMQMPSLALVNAHANSHSIRSILGLPESPSPTPSCSSNAGKVETVTRVSSPNLELLANVAEGIDRAVEEARFQPLEPAPANNPLNELQAMVERVGPLPFPQENDENQPQPEERPEPEPLMPAVSAPQRAALQPRMNRAENENTQIAAARVLFAPPEYYVPKKMRASMRYSWFFEQRKGERAE